MSLFNEVADFLKGNPPEVEDLNTQSLTTSSVVPLSSLHTGPLGMQLIEYFEGTRLSAYQDSKGVWTIGVGHTGGVSAGQTITMQQAIAFLSADLKWAEDFIKSHVKVNLTQNQFDAIVSFVFNVGVGNFLHSSVYTNLNASNFTQVPYSLSLWNRSGGRVITGLVTRRHAEGILFRDGTLHFEPVSVPDSRQG